MENKEKKVEDKVEKREKLIDFEELNLAYQIAKTFQNTINSTRVEQYASTSPFVYEYNKIRKNVKKIDRNVVKYTTHLTSYEGIYRVNAEINQFNAVKSEINILVAYLETKLGKKEEIIIDLLGVLGSKLRPTFRDVPTSERHVQENVDIVLNVAGFNYLREKVTIPYSSKHFVPDFTFDNENTCLEIKFSNRANKEKELIDEINGDIKAYKTRYQKIIFLVYDLGFIRDVAQFKKDIHNDKDIYVEVIKH